MLEGQPLRNYRTADQGRALGNDLPSRMVDQSEELEPEGNPMTNDNVTLPLLPLTSGVVLPGMVFTMAICTSIGMEVDMPFT